MRARGSRSLADLRQWLDWYEIAPSTLDRVLYILALVGAVSLIGTFLYFGGLL